MRESLAIARGTLDVIVLRALAWDRMHGFEIVEWIERSTGKEMDITDAAIYQSLYRMERRGLVKASWALTENNRRARYYALTAAGRVHLRVESVRWARYAALMSGLLTPPATRPRRA